jgi:hypothetical protein
MARSVRRTDPSSVPLEETEQRKTLNYEEAIAFMGVSRRQFRRYVQSHKLTAAPKVQGEPSRFYVNDLEELKDGEPSEDEVSLIPQAQMIQVMTSLIAQAERHAEAMVKLITEPSEKLHAQQSEHLATLGDQLKDCRKEINELYTSNSKMLGKMHEREIERLREMGSERRKDAMLGMLKTAAPTLLSGISGHFSKNALATLGPLFEQFLKNVDRETLAKMAEQIPSNEAKLAMMRIVQVVEKEMQKKKDGSKEGPANGAPANDETTARAKAAEDALKGVTS